MAAEKQNQKPSPVLWPFWLELVPFAILPFVIWWSTTPTNVLHAASWGRLLESVGIFGTVLLYITEIPIGIIGLTASKKMTTLRLTTKLLSIAHLALGAIMAAGTLLLIGLILFGGLSH